MNRVPPCILAALLSAAPSAAQDWKTYGGDYASTRFSPLREINASNVHRLRVNWVFQHGVPGKHEATPLYENGILYVTGASGHAWALDARTGRVIWHYERPLPRPMALCCGPVNRGFGLSGDRLFLATLDAHLLALDKKTGAVLWEAVIADYKQNYSGTAAPLVVKNKVIVGIAGAEFATRGFIDAYSVETGERVWRFWTVPAPGEPGSETWLDGQDAWKRGGGSTWVTGSYDPELNLVYWTTGNPAPDFNAQVRPGDNLYTNSILALDADTGKLRWHFQATPADTHDWDGTSEPVLTELAIGGEKRKALLQANRNGFFYTLDRQTGRFLNGFPFVHQTWARGLEANGRPIVIPGLDPSPEGTEVCPSMGGGKNWNHMAYNPEAGLVFVPVGEGCDLFFLGDLPEPEPFLSWFGSRSERSAANPHWGALRAYDPATGKLAWEHKMILPLRGSALTTAGELVFIGDTFGYLSAFHTRTGKLLWKMNTGADASRLGNIVRGLSAPPITYLLDGRQHVTVLAGGTLFDFTLPAD